MVVIMMRAVISLIRHTDLTRTEMQSARNQTVIPSLINYKSMQNLKNSLLSTKSDASENINSTELTS